LRKIIFKKSTDTINFDEVTQNMPIFAWRDGKLSGMIVHEEDGWILRTGGDKGSSGYHKTLRNCIEIDMSLRFDFYTE